MACLLALSATDVAAGAVEAPGEQETRDEEPTHVRVAASDRYRASRVHAFLFGGGYRALWEAEIQLPLLDLAREGGGLSPAGRFGGLQTAVLGFRGADGRSYTFRGTDKDPSAVLPEVLEDTVVQSIVQDQMAAQHPGGPLAASVLARAAGVLTVEERMVVMPDDPALGVYREEFAGMVGMFSMYPQPATGDREGYAGAAEIIDHEALYARLERDDETRVDVEAFLRARLVDILLGDFDRHRKQWRWLRRPGESSWQPLPEDRDMAFVRFDGFGPRVMKLYIPILQRYDEDYPGIKGLTMHGWEQDRWLLPRLDWEQWERVVADLQARLTDDVIDRAIAALPPEYAALDGDRLRRDLRGRRDRLPEAARSFYEHLARRVDLRTSDAANHVRIDRAPDGRLLIEVRERTEHDRDACSADDAGRAASGGVPEGRVVFRRAFRPRETRVVRLYLRGGADVVEVAGRSRRIGLRIIAESGEKCVADHAGGTWIYDPGANVRLSSARRNTRVVRRVYEPPSDNAGFVDVEGIPPRDWGSDTIPIPELGFEPDVGAFVGAAVAHTRYDFRKHPWSSQYSLGLGWAFEANAPRLRSKVSLRSEIPGLLATFELDYSGIEVLRFYGFGNETNDDGRDSRFRVESQFYSFRPSLEARPFGEALRVSLGAELQLYRTKENQRLIDELDPYGNNDFGLVGAVVHLSYDRRRSITRGRTPLQLPFHDNPAAGYPTSGFVVDVTGSLRPPVLDVVDPYGWIEGSVAGYVSVGPDARATIGVRLGAKETFGRTPYFDAASVGGGLFFSGSATNRGFRSRRFLGDTAVYGNVDVRVFLARLKIVVPTDVGVQGFADVGRVWLNDESSDDWHPSGGGGIWLSPLVRTNTISLSVATSPEGSLAYLRFGFHY